MVRNFMASGLGPPTIVLVRYGELSLKGGNRGAFERALARNITAAASPISPVEVERRAGRLVVYPERRAAAVARRLQDVFGIKSVSPAWSVERTADATVAAGRTLLRDALKSYPKEAPPTFRVRTQRSDKRFPMTSTEFDRHVAARILDGIAVPVRMKDAELELGIEIREDEIDLFIERLPGPGGLPVGTQGGALCLLSGGIDSPVAAWLALKRGCRVSYVSFHSYPYIGEPSKKKVADLARALGRYQAKSLLFIVPFTEIQVAIRDLPHFESYRTVLYRRMMQRIASRLAREHGFAALVTGESLGQVASQTIENMTCIGAAADTHVLRPLVAFDKEETIALARRIGTLEISNLPEPDCCTVFMPRRPVIHGKLEKCLEAEARLDVDGLVGRAVEGVEIVRIEAEE